MDNSEKPIKQRILNFLDQADKMQEKAEILKAFPKEGTVYVSNSLVMLEKSGQVVGLKGKWGLKSPF